jgi:predicted flap endonuclease-1-like 5' DNA nuclease
MSELHQSNIVLLVVIALLVLALLVWLLLASRKTRVKLEERPADEPARRNQALIDANPAATIVPLAPGVGDVGVVAPPVPLPTEGGGDDLTRLKGVGPKLADQLRAMGVTRFEQIAAWDDAEIERIDAQLGRFQGRIRRDDWPAQARLLAAGDTAAYEAKFGKL